MSTVQPKDRNVVSPIEAAPAPRPRRALYAAAAAVAVVGLASAGVLAMHHSGGGGSSTAAAAAGTIPTGPLTLPASVGALAPDPDDPTRTGDWKAEAAQQLGSVEYHARTYRAKGGSLWIRVVEARADLSGKLELAWAADAGQKVGDVNCTNTTKFSAGDTPKARPTMMICWRTSPERSVYALAIDPKAKTALGTAAAAAAAQQAWGE